MVPLGMQNTLTCLFWPECQRRYCSSENSCAPPPVPRMTPISRFSSMDMLEGSRPASRIASVEAAIASGTTRETCLRSRASTQASSSNSGISPATCTGRAGRIEAGDALHAGFTCQNGAAKGLFADPIRADHAHSGDHYARKHVLSDAVGSFSVMRKWDNPQNAAGSLHLRSILPHQVQLLQFRLGCIFRVQFSSRYVDRVCADMRRAAETAATDGRPLRVAAWTPFTWAAALLLYWI